jgi:penicillin-binding protein 1A
LGSIGLDPKTGYVKIWVGGIGHQYFKYDHINSNRQVGSTFKPFIYGTAIIEQGTSPCQKVQDIQ